MSRYPFPSFPRGWFALALSHELGEAAVLTVRAFGQEIVLFRGEDGKANALSAFCPHLGAHLGKGGCVKGGAIRCAFHGMRFDGRGECVEIPGVAKIPPGLRTPAWELREVDGAILAWHDPAGARPSFEPPSYFESRGAEGWTDMAWHTWPKLHAHPQETSENSVDLAHFPAVHGYSSVSIVEPIDIDGDTLRISYSMTRGLDNVGMPGQTVESVFRVRVHGLGYSVVEVTVPTFNTEFRTYVLCTPIDEDTVILRGGGTMKAMPDPNMTAMISKLFFQGFVQDVEQDFEIWENKAYFERPVLAANDGPIGAYRKWCRRFYDETRAEAAE
ncbi:MAG: Rieske 2Fe-2S domain-containing protein [Sandaracinus sp.]|nr:Rieske 2Fe-2S domain-containing protein [Sandaracinus sp.]